MTRISALWTAAVMSAHVLMAAGSVDLFQAVRNNDLAALRTAIAVQADLNVRDRRGATPLVQAASFGSAEAMKLLLDAGADVNARSGFGATALVRAAGDPEKTRLLVARGAEVNVRTQQGRTPLIVAASHDGAVETVRLLLDKGADLRAADNLGWTALEAAAYAGDADTVRLLLQRGADPDRADKSGSTALMSAAASGNVAMIRLLLAKGARVNAANTSGDRVRHGEIALKLLTPLMYAAPHSRAEALGELLGAGAEVNARDARRMTPLMLAVASETQDPAVVGLLLARGAEANLASQVGETALDWARKFGHPAVIGALEKAGARAGAAFQAPERKGDPPAGAREAIERSMTLLQKSGAEFFRQSACVGCHHQNLIQMATAAARGAGVRVDEAAAKETVQAVRSQWEALQEGLLQRLDGPANPDLQVFSALGMAAEREPPDPVLEALAASVAGKQQRDGGWKLDGVPRAPLEESNIARTAMSARTLQVYGPPGRKAEFHQRIARARGWLEQCSPGTTDDHVWHLLGLDWTGSSRAKVQAAKALLQLQRSDGGWAQNLHLASDPYGTGTALWALHAAGALKPGDAAYRRGVKFLLSTQFGDGSWYVRSRAPKFQPYFESGFPFGDDQWISSAATAWAVMALAPAAGAP